VVPNDTFFAIQSWHYGLIDLPRAWTITTGSPSVLVALVDDGTRFDHPALAGNLTSDGYDFVTAADTLPLCAGGTITNDADDSTGYDPNPTIPASYSLDSTKTCYNPDDIGAHSVHVAGTIGAVGHDRGSARRGSGGKCGHVRTSLSRRIPRSPGGRGGGAGRGTGVVLELRVLRRAPGSGRKLRARRRDRRRFLRHLGLCQRPAGL